MKVFQATHSSSFEDARQNGGWRAALACFALSLVALLPCQSGAWAATLIVSTAPGERSNALDTLRLVVQAYGIEMRHIEANEDIRELDVKNPVAVVMTGGAYASYQQRHFQRVPSRPALIDTLPMLIIDPMDGDYIARGPDAADAGSPLDADLQVGEKGHCLYSVSGENDVAQELAGRDYPCTATDSRSRHLEGSERNGVGIVMALVASGQRYPVFIRDRRGAIEKYYLALQHREDHQAAGLSEALSSQFGDAASMAMFVRRVAGPYAWHSEARYANFTIDDPWLREPYGNLSYRKLVEQMSTTRFHTTIAFVPWNFDRSEPEVVALFKESSDKLSLVVHGNNHDHEEFALNRSDAVYEANIRQGLARMGELRNRTGLEFDQVMVFPHQVARASAIALLRRYGFRCTVNLEYRVGLAPKVAGPAHIWDGFVQSDQGIPSLKRELAGVSEQRLAILSFLQTPLLLHTHQEFFAESSFSPVAQAINQMNPGIQWTGLGPVCEHLYLKRKDDDGRYRVLLFGDRTIVANDASETRIFRFHRSHPEGVVFQRATANGRSIDFTRGGESIEFEASLAPGEQAVIGTEYAEQIESAASMEISKRDPRMWILRHTSDFRDIVLSTNGIGRRLTNIYYERLRGSYDRIDIILVIALAMLAVLVAAFGGRLATRARRQRNAHDDVL